MNIYPTPCCAAGNRPTLPLLGFRADALNSHPSSPKWRMAMASKKYAGMFEMFKVWGFVEANADKHTVGRGNRWCGVSSRPGLL